MDIDVLAPSEYGKANADLSLGLGVGRKVGHRKTVLTTRPECFTVWCPLGLHLYPSDVASKPVRHCSHSNQDDARFEWAQHFRESQLRGTRLPLRCARSFVLHIKRRKETPETRASNRWTIIIIFWRNLLLLFFPLVFLLLACDPLQGQSSKRKRYCENDRKRERKRVRWDTGTP